MKNKDLKKRIIDISYKHKLSHLGSCLTAVDIIDDIYASMKPLTFKSWDERFILSAGHAGLALYVVIEKYYGIDAEEIFEHHGVHPDRCKQHYIHTSSGSLGQGLPIAVGVALANRKKKVHCLISDGECAEGSISEAVRIADNLKLENLNIYVNFNGYGAYGETQIYDLPRGITKVEFTGSYGDRKLECLLPFLQGQDAHYHVMTEEEYAYAQEILR